MNEFAIFFQFKITWLFGLWGNVARGGRLRVVSGPRSHGRSIDTFELHTCIIDSGFEPGCVVKRPIFAPTLRKKDPVIVMA